MAKVAIDVVLLPSEEVTEEAISINKELLKEYENKIVLDKEKCLPHISLCMGCVEESDLPKVETILSEIANDFSVFELALTELYLETIPTGKTVSGLQVENTERLQALHESIMNKLRDYLSFDAQIPMLFNPPEVEEITLFWINDYKRHYENPSKFNPHITLGFGEAKKTFSPKKFTSSRVALCQLGNYCTCRKVLASFDLS